MNKNKNVEKFFKKKGGHKSQITLKIKPHKQFAPQHGIHRSIDFLLYTLYVIMLEKISKAEIASLCIWVELNGGGIL